MRRWLSTLLVLSLLLTICGCNGQNMKEPIPFYYLRRNYVFGSENGIISPETVEGSQFNSIPQMLSAYLRGPNDLILESPFPAGTFLLDTRMADGILTVTLSDKFATLSGVSLSLACCALAKTAMAYSNMDAVSIRCPTALLDGEKSITIRSSDLYLYDNYSVDNTDATE